jgi:hypothetical protein
LDHAERVIAHLKAHRLGREEKIAGVMQAHPGGHVGRLGGKSVR